jgi:UDP-N-acetylmuramyl pentapeptide phosphotransferase/UDP-N-acetylglucosamine-1-phosphate transferase
MVRFFGGVLPSMMGCFPLSAMALGFLHWNKGEDVK